MNSNLEIEKKFLVKYLPEELETYEHHSIAQGYVSTKPVVRIRKWDDDYILTIKSSGLLSHTEIEKSLTSDEFQSLKEMVQGNPIEKVRYIVPLDSYGYDDLKIELDIFEGILQGLIIAEVEFPDIKKAESFVAPDFLGIDVTNDNRYYNSTLSSFSKEEIAELLNTKPE